MAIGFPPKSTHTLPAGRRSFTDTAPKPDAVRPGSFSDGQPRDGTPAGNEHRSPAANAGYLDASARAHRAEEGSQPYPSQSNPTVHSKATKRYGRDGSKLSGATYKSPGDQPAPQQRDELPPSLPQKSYPRAEKTSERVGWVNGENRAATHPNTKRHDGGHESGRHANTDAAPGQAHSASGGKFGSPQVRPAPAPRAGVGTADHGAMDRKSYTGTGYSGGKS
jgi:hypothetical protein